MTYLLLQKLDFFFFFLQSIKCCKDTATTKKQHADCPATAAETRGPENYRGLMCPLLRSTEPCKTLQKFLPVSRKLLLHSRNAAYRCYKDTDVSSHNQKITSAFTHFICNGICGSNSKTRKCSKRKE